jgi:hypothetical protein
MSKSNQQINKENEAESNSPDSPAVIAYRLGQVEAAVKEGFQSHNEKLDAIVNNFATKADYLNLDKRLTDIESDRKWLVRLIVGAVATSLLALIGIGLKLNP